MPDPPTTPSPPTTARGIPASSCATPASPTHRPVRARSPITAPFIPLCRERWSYAEPQTADPPELPHHPRLRGPARRPARQGLRLPAGHYPRRTGSRLPDQRAARPAQHSRGGGHVLHRGRRKGRSPNLPPVPGRSTASRQEGAGGGRRLGQRAHHPGGKGTSAGGPGTANPGGAPLQTQVLAVSEHSAGLLRGGIGGLARVPLGPAEPLFEGYVRRITRPARTAASWRPRASAGRPFTNTHSMPAASSNGLAY